MRIEGFLIGGLALALAGAAIAQPFAAGARVQASPLMMDSNWRACTVISQSGNSYQVDCGQGPTRREIFTVPGQWVKAAAPATAQKAPPPAQPAQAKAPAAAPKAPAAASAAGLKVVEYACYGSGGRIMIGLGFKVTAPGRYTDLDGKNPGTYAIQGTNVVFRGGHLDGQTGRDLKDGKFTIGTLAGCEPF
jgi:pyruvate/2-oxoglutarate dehydrogenase complex dihydrolipoamide acyltransferase (E2) component